MLEFVLVAVATLVAGLLLEMLVALLLIAVRRPLEDAVASASRIWWVDELVRPRSSRLAITGAIVGSVATAVGIWLFMRFDGWRAEVGLGFLFAGPVGAIWLGSQWRNSPFRHRPGGGAA